MGDFKKYEYGEEEEEKEEKKTKPAERRGEEKAAEKNEESEEKKNEEQEKGGEELEDSSEFWKIASSEQRLHWKRFAVEVRRMKLLQSQPDESRPPKRRMQRL